ncbi:hypothetical protein IGI04_029860 [Brassica rapa subsp. trilocularis]|uniref:Uncharacterized protein n=1 Tax=Brassica rapa subsp. trilocularis TaxID=1813537 RepID=A0ABQ7LS95_BRACM|nr:hypothetical protein IGI04_029860 [Brassica rapa subsp. trilocularis]
MLESGDADVRKVLIKSSPNHDLCELHHAKRWNFKYKKISFRTMTTMLESRDADVLYTSLLLFVFNNFHLLFLGFLVFFTFSFHKPIIEFLEVNGRFFMPIAENGGADMISKQRQQQEGNHRRKTVLSVLWYKMIMEQSLTATILKLTEHTAPAKETTRYPHQSSPQADALDSGT